jgi:tRNA (cytidine/uridine-2'-O-)-methyltransferase
MPFNVVLIHPEIPQNTGNIGRLCLATGSKLHLVDPLGFELTDKYLLRAGLDYWPHLQWQRYASTDHFFSSHRPKQKPAALCAPSGVI